MKTARIKQVLQEAAKLPPAKARALVAAVCDRRSLQAKTAPDSPADVFIATAMKKFEEVLVPALIRELERPMDEETP